MRKQPVRCAFLLHLLHCLAESECFRLGEDIRDQHVMMVVQGVQRVGERDEIGGNELGSLVDELVKGVLTVGSWLAPVDRTSLIIYLSSIYGDVLAVALHRQLLEIGREALKVLLIRKDSDRLRIEE